MKSGLITLGIILGIIITGAIMNYFLLPIYVAIGIIKPLVLTLSFLDKVYFCLITCTFSWIFIIYIAFIGLIIILILLKVLKSICPVLNKKI